MVTTYPNQIPRHIERKLKKIGRNEPCPCGSGKKYKKCCLPGNKTAKREPYQKDGQLAKIICDVKGGIVLREFIPDKDGEIIQGPDGEVLRGKFGEEFFLPDNMIEDEEPPGFAEDSIGQWQPKPPGNFFPVKQRGRPKVTVSREEVLNLAADGMSNRTIGKKFNVDRKTVARIVRGGE